ncbi:MAG TPA: hypothetical protein VFC74_03035 [Oscillospiraceae bacterium]|nr:hypothetical protein [Oscillospiraceae bacterium]
MKRKIISSVAMILGILLIISSLAMMAKPGVVFALELVGDELGLRLEPSNTALFDVKNMNPGDTKQAGLSICNGGKCPFTAYLSMVKVSGTRGKGDLYPQLEMTVTYLDEEIYHGPVSGFQQYKLGQLQPNDNQPLDFTVHLPGPTTGNEYQGSTLGVKLVFTATQECTPPTPPKPDIPATSGFDTIVLLAGMSSLLFGILLRRRKMVSK